MTENEQFIIDAKYDMGVGFAGVDHTQKLVRHFEVVAGPYRNLTIDLYENGLINCNVHVRGYSGCVAANPPHIKHSMNLTGGQKIGDKYIQLVEGIFRPFCERIDISETYVPPSKDGNQTPVPRWLGYMPNMEKPTYTRPLIYEARGLCDANIVQQNIEYLIDQAFYSTLPTVKALHESMSSANGILTGVCAQIQNHARYIERIKERIQEIIDI